MLPAMMRGLPLVCDAFGFVALCSVVAVRKKIQDRFDNSQVHKPVPYVLSAVQDELKRVAQTTTGTEKNKSLSGSATAELRARRFSGSRVRPCVSKA